MEQTPTITILTLALLTAPALAGVSTESIVGSSSVWMPEDKLTETEPGANLGTQIALADNLAVAGAPDGERVKVFEPVDTGPGWTELEELTAEDGDSAGFGSAVALDPQATTIAVGARDASAVHVFEEEEDSSWSHVATLTAPGTTCLGHAVAVTSAGEILAGAPCERDSVFVYEATGSAWEQAQTIEGDGDRFGWALGVHGDRIAVASMGDAVEVFERTEDGWGADASIRVADEGLPTARFGWDVDLHGDWLSVGAPSAAENPVSTGAAYLYHEEESGWALSETLVPSDAALLEPSSEIGFGSAVDLADERALVGAPGEDSTPGVPAFLDAGESDPVCRSLGISPTCVRPGAVYVFAKEESGPAGEGTEGWSQTVKITAPDGKPADVPRWMVWDAHPDAFGSAVGSYDNTIAVGAPTADLAPGDDAGAVYLYSQVSPEGAL